MLLGLVLYFPSASVSSVFIVSLHCAMYMFKFFVVTLLTLSFSELSLVGLALDLVD